METTTFILLLIIILGSAVSLVLYYRVREYATECGYDSSASRIRMWFHFFTNGIEDRKLSRSLRTIAVLDIAVGLMALGLIAFS